MNTHTGGQYTYPTVGGVIPTNLNAYQRQQQPVQPQRTATQQQYAHQTQQQYAQQQYIQQQVQQRTAAANTQQQQTNSSNRVVATNKVQPVGQYASSTLSILSSAISAEKNSKKRKAEDNAKVLNSVIPLFNDATNSKSSKCDEDEEVINDNEEEQTETASERKVKQLKRELEAVKKDNQRLMERRNNVMKNMVKFHEIYETGLDGIARMNDLRYVPDNVLPDELPDTVSSPSK